MGKIMLDAKKKSLIVLTVVAFGYLGHEVYDLMKQNVDSASPMPQMTHRYASHPQLPSNAVSPLTTANAAEIEPAQPLQAASIQTIKPAVLPSQPLATGQRAYLHMVNQYELAKMKRRLLEERAAIAAAQHRIATLNKQTRQIDDSLNTDDSLFDDTATNTHHSVPYLLSYVDRQHGEWTATLSRNGHYFEVQVGSALSNGEKVLAISRRGVTLQDHDERERVTFDGMVTVPTNPKRPKALGNKVKVVNAMLQDQPPADLQGQARRALIAAGMLSSKKDQPALAEKTILKRQEDSLKAKMANANKLAAKISASLDKKNNKVVITKQDSVIKKPVKTVSKSVGDQLKVASKNIVAKKDKLLAVEKKPDNHQPAISQRTDVKRSPIVFAAVTGQVKALPAEPKKTLKQDAPTQLAQLKPPTPIEKHLAEHTATPGKSISTLSNKAPRHTSVRYSQDEHRFLAIPKAGLTIQLIGSYHPDIIENFAIANDLGDQAIQVYVTNRGKRWYMLFYGTYKTEKAAQAAMRDLPPNLTPEHPWVRRVATVQHQIRDGKHHRHS
jgi:septal ring-binding cell division protein DamX